VNVGKWCTPEIYVQNATQKQEDKS
jgi:hypothetical protein